MNKITGYLVQYSTGSYEDYFDHCVAVYTNKEEAEKAVERVNKEHNDPERGVISDKDWDDILEEYYEWFDENQYENSDIQSKYPNLLGKPCYDYEGWENDHNQTIKEQESLQEDIVMEYYPKLSREEARKEIEIRNNLDMMEFREYGSAWINEIDIYID